MARITGPNEGEVEKAARFLADRCGRRARELKLPVSILGPVPAPIERIRGRVRYQLVFKGETTRSVAVLLSDVLGDRSARREGGVQIAVDIDSLDML
jgi:primosomal protein N'